MENIKVSYNNKNVKLRKALPEDIPFVACCVLAAVDLYDFKEPSVEKDIAETVCSREDTLYSYRHAVIAEVDGVPAGCLLSYDGAIYENARKITFKFFKDAGREMTDTDIETEAGEYYLDSMAIAPVFRGCGIGHMLMEDAIAESRRRGFRKVSLIVECTKPHLRDYYAELGFKPEREMNAFGDRYLKMVLDQN